MSDTHAVSDLPAAACLWTKCTHVAETKLDGGDVNGVHSHVCIYFVQHSIGFLLKFHCFLT